MALVVQLKIPKFRRSTICRIPRKIKICSMMKKSSDQFAGRHKRVHDIELEEAVLHRCSFVSDIRRYFMLRITVCVLYVLLS